MSFEPPPPLYFDSDTDSSISDDLDAPSPKPLKLYRSLAYVVMAALRQVNRTYVFRLENKPKRSLFIATKLGTELESIEDPDIYNQLKYEIIELIYDAKQRDSENKMENERAQAV